MDSYLKLIQTTPLPVILIVAGIVFLLLSITGGISGKIKVEPGRQTISGIIGGLLLITGFLLYLGSKDNKPDKTVEMSTNQAAGPTAMQTSVPSPAAEGKSVHPYIQDLGLPYFMTRQITVLDIAGKRAAELILMRNEIYARHGLKFSRPDLQNYFNRQNWYVPKYEPGTMPAGILSPVEQGNIQFLKYQESRFR